MDGRKCITPNCSFQLSPGIDLQCKADLKGYVSRSQSVTLTNDQTISFELSPEPPLPELPLLFAPRRRSWPGWFSKERTPVINCLSTMFELAASGPPGTWELTPGSHRLRLMAGNQELVADPRHSRQMQPWCSTVLTSSSRLRRRQKSRLPGIVSTAQATLAAVEDFLRRYPNSSFRSQAESKLEELYWAKASSGGSFETFRNMRRSMLPRQVLICRLRWRNRAAGVGGYPEHNRSSSSEEISRSKSKGPISRPRSGSARRSHLGAG